MLAVAGDFTLKDFTLRAASVMHQVSIQNLGAACEMGAPNLQM